jgi:hypothetical protein
MKKIIFSENPNQSLPQLCDICGQEISDGDECYYHGEGVYTCSKECAEKFET